MDQFIQHHLHDMLPEDWHRELEAFRYPSPTDDTFHRSDTPPLPEPFEQWFALLERDPLKYKWVYRRLQRYTITVSEYELKKLPSKAVLERAGLLVLDCGYYHNVLGADFDDEVMAPKDTVL